MTPQEQEMIQGLIDRVQQTRLQEKDPDAEQLLQQSLGRNPDALYILAQTVLVQKYAVDQAQKQLTDLKAELDQARAQTQEPRHTTSFLGSLLGHNDPPPPPPPLPPSPNPQYTPVPNYAPGASYPPAGGYAPQSGYAQPQAQFGSSFGVQQGGGGFLRSALQTATGVAAGALAFQGIESLMHGFGGGGGFGGGQAFGGGGSGPREEIVNNYYGDSGSGRDRDSGLSADIEDRRDDNADSADRFAGSDTDNSGSDFDSGTDNSSFDSGTDDSSFDSGGDSGGDDSSF